MILGILLLLNLIESSIFADSARARIRFLDPTRSILTKASEENIHPSDPAISGILHNAEIAFRSVYYPLPNFLLDPSTYKKECCKFIERKQIFRGDDLRVVLTVAMRMRDIELFREALDRAQDDVNGMAEEYELEYFVFELTAPFTAPTFLERFLMAAQLDRLIIRTVFSRLTAINFAHCAIFEKHCKSFSGESLKVAGLALNPFHRITFNNLGNATSFQCLSLKNLVLIYSIESEFDHELKFNIEAVLDDIVAKLAEIIAEDSSALLSVFIYQRYSKEGVILKTAGHGGPLFLVLDCIDDQCSPIEEMATMVNSNVKLAIANFTIKDSHLFIGFPGSLVDAFDLELFGQASGWFVDLPQNRMEVKKGFKCLLKTRNINAGTELVYALLKELIETPVYDLKSWSSDEEDANLISSSIFLESDEEEFVDHFSLLSLIARERQEVVFVFFAEVVGISIGLMIVFLYFIMSREVPK
jgi:hypothetical protein